MENDYVECKTKRLSQMYDSTNELDVRHHE